MLTITEDMLIVIIDVLNKKSTYMGLKHFNLRFNELCMI